MGRYGGCSLAGQGYRGGAADGSLSMITDTAAVDSESHGQGRTYRRLRLNPSELIRAPCSIQGTSRSRPGLWLSRIPNDRGPLFDTEISSSVPGDCDDRSLVETAFLLNVGGGVKCSHSVAMGQNTSQGLIRRILDRVGYTNNARVPRRPGRYPIVSVQPIEFSPSFAMHDSASEPP